MRGHHAQRHAGFVERAEDSGALGRGVLGHGVGMLGVPNAVVDLLGMGHPVAELVDGGAVVGEQIGEDGAGVFEKEELGSGVVGEEALGNGSGFSLVVGLFADGPVGTALVFGIEDDIAAGGIVEFAEILAIGIEDNGGFTALFDLVEDGAHQ